MAEAIDSTNEPEVVNFEFSATNIEEEQQLVFGWAYVCETVEGTSVTDFSDQVIEPLELEAAVYQFVRWGGMASVEHTHMYAGSLVESIVFTEEKQQALGIPPGTVPIGWWVGIYVYAKDVFDKVKSGELKMLSIAGKAIKEVIEDDD